MQETTHLELVPLRDGPAADLDVLFLLNNLSIGGSETKIVRLANSLSANGVEVGIAYLNAPHDLLKEIQGDIPVWHLARQGKYSPRTAAALRLLVREQRPRALVAVNLYPTLYVLAAAMRFRHRPRTIALVNTTAFNPGQEWRRSLYRPVLRCLDWTVYGCDAQRRMWLDGRSGMWHRSCVIYNGVDTRHFQAARDGTDLMALRALYGIGERAFVIGTVGRLAPEKGQSLLIDAVAQVRAAGLDVHLLIVGDGRLRSALERHVAQNGLNAKATFTGTVADVRPLLAIMDAFVLPSLYVETFSNAALEAMAMHKPVVLSAVGGAEEMIRDGIEGFLLAPQQLQPGLPEVLATLAKDPGLRTRVGEAARLRVESSFSFHGMVDQYRNLIGSERHGRVHA